LLQSPENGLIFLQVKATEKTRPALGGQAISFRIERANLQHWLNEFYPVILIVYDVSVDKCWWLPVQDHFGNLPGFNPFRAGQTVTVHLPIGQVLDASAIRQFAALRDKAIQGGPSHE
jgi:hypothetical protein